MKIKEITIYGFGQWVDHTFTFPDGNLITILGKNESGKTTLHQFILFMLFGMSPKEREFYRPKTSSKVGGRIILEHAEQGFIHLERLGESQGKAKCYDQHGTERDEQWLRELLGNINRETFQSIYSFSNQDLSILQTIDEKDISELLMSVGLTGSAAVYSVEKQLNAAVKEQFKPTGKNPVINKKLKELQEQAKQLSDSKRQEKLYKSQMEELSALERKHEAKKGKIAAVSEKLEKQKLLEKSVPIQKEIHHVSKELQKLERFKDFPLHKKEQMAVLRNELHQAERECQLRQAEAAAYGQKKTELEASAISAKKKAALTDLIHKKAEMMLASERQITLKQDYQYKLREIEDTIRQKQIPLAPEELEELDLPFYIEKEWSTLHKEEERLQGALIGARQKQMQLQKEKQQLEEERSHLRKEQLGEVHVEELQQRVSAYEQSEKAGVQQRNHMLRMVRQMLDEKKKQQRMIAGIFLLITLLTAMTGFISDLPWLYILSLGSIAGVFFFFKRQLQTAAEIKKQQLDWNTQKEKREETLDVTKEEYAEAKQILEEQKGCRQQLQILEHSIQQTIGKINETEAEIRDLKLLEDRLMKAVSEQRMRFPFLQGIETAHWQDVFHFLQKLLMMTNDKKNLQNALERTTARLVEFSEQVRSWFGSDIEMDDISLKQMIRKLEETGQQEQLNQHEWEQVTQSIKEAENKLRTVQQKAEHCRAERDALLMEAGVESEEAYAKGAEQKLRYDKLINRKQELKNNLDMILPEVWQDTYEGDAAGDYYSQMKQYELELAEAEEALEQLKRQIAERRLELQQLESEESISAQMHRFAIEKEALKEMVQQWAVEKVALKMLEHGKTQYKDKHLTLVLDAAAAYFKELTSGQYDTIYPPASDIGFEVENSRKRQRFSVQELSQGAKDQLYIALRLAINEVMAQNSGFVFLMDDAFVHFDSQRIKQMHAILKRLSKRQQILLFTCRKELAEAAGGEIIQLS